MDLFSGNTKAGLEGAADSSQRAHGSSRLHRIVLSMPFFCFSAVGPIVVDPLRKKHRLKENFKMARDS